MRTEQIKFGMIRTQEEFDQLKRFAESFEHKIDDGSIFPIFTIERGDQMIGYFNVMRHPVLYPAFHPMATTPRDFYDAAQYLKQYFCLGSIDQRFPHGICVMALPRGHELESAVEKVGFKNTKKEIWHAIP